MLPARLPVSCWPASWYIFFWGGGEKLRKRCMVDKVLRIQRLEKYSKIRGVFEIFVPHMSHILIK